MPYSDNLPPATPEEQALMLAQLSLIDPQRKGVNPGDLRVFYPGVGWDKIFQTLTALEDDGRIKSKRTTKGRVPLVHYTVIDNPTPSAPVTPAG